MASVDKMKTNLTPQEASKLLDQSTRGKVFEDGPYQYRIFVSFPPMASAQAGMIITVVNTPDSISGDLVGYALTRIGIILRNYKEKFEVLPSKIWVDSFGHEINFLPLIGGSPKGEFLDIRNAENAKNMFGSFSMKDFVETNNKVLDKFNRFINHFVSKYPVYELPAIPDDLDAKEKNIFNKKIVPIIKENHPVKGKNLKLSPVRFDIKKAEGVSKVSYSSNATTADEALSVKYTAQFTISADKTHLMVKAFDYVNTGGYNNPNADAAEVARIIMRNQMEKITSAIEKYILSHSPVDCGVSFSTFYGNYTTGSGPRD
jgi:hypothetical protein